MAARLSLRAARQATLSASSAATRPAFFAPLRTQAQCQSRVFSAAAALKEKKYTEDHEWIELSADGKTATLGISQYAANALGDVVYIELPEKGLEVSAGEAIGAVESVKSASDILTPVSGEIAEVNEELTTKPGGINKDPEGNGWVAKVTVSGEVEGKTMTKAEYTAYTEEA